MEWILDYLWGQSNDDLYIIRYLLRKKSTATSTFLLFKTYARMGTWWWTHKCFMLKTFCKGKIGCYNFEENVYYTRGSNHWDWLNVAYKDSDISKNWTKFSLTNSAIAAQKLLLCMDKIIRWVGWNLWRFTLNNSKQSTYTQYYLGTLIDYDFVGAITKLMVSFFRTYFPKIVDL